MSQSKHTQGPWEPNGNGIHKRVSSGYAKCVAIAYDPEEGNGVTEVTLANARLIAAAPDLLAFIVGFVTAYDAGMDFSNESLIRSLVTDAREAVNKAEGGL